MKIAHYLVGAGLAALALPALAATAPGVDFTGAGLVGTNNAVWTLGYKFTANTAVNVVGLGNWNRDAGGTRIGLWDSSQTLLASATLTGSETPVGTADWLFARITPVALTAGSSYFVGAFNTSANYTF